MQTFAFFFHIQSYNWQKNNVAPLFCKFVYLYFVSGFCAAYRF